MIAVARMAMLDLRTVAPNRYPGLALFGLIVVVLADKRPVVMLPALVLLFTSQVAAQPFLIADKAGLETLHAVLPVHRRTVLFGHYVWALGCFLATAAAGAALGFLLARVESADFGGQTLLTALTLSWAIFVVNVAIQFPLFIRFGFSLMCTFLPMALVIMGVTRFHLTIVSLAELEHWLPAIWLAGAAVLAASVAVACTVDRRRTRRSGLLRTPRPASTAAAG